VAERKRSGPKKIVYLWGAGATQGEAQNLGSRISLLMRDTEAFGEGITGRILRRAGPSVTASFGSGQGVDIEKLISLLASSGVHRHFELAESLRTQYFAELLSSLATANVLENPQLSIRLFEMHNDRRFNEEVESLSGVITTNHDGLLQIASQIVYGEVNLGFSYSSEDFAPSVLSATPPILQLHGSFSWQFGVPIRIAILRRNSKYSTDTVWIPPTTQKEVRSYPFSKLAALAYELLARQCDVLRVVGASLTQNDWNVLSLIFNAQRHREFVSGTPFRIELIMPHDTGEQIARDCAFLKHLTPIGYLTEGRFDDYKEARDLPSDSDLSNPFAYWLNEKYEFHTTRGDFDGEDARMESAETPGSSP